MDAGDDLTLIKLAREIALDHHDTETILKRYRITPEKWAKIKDNPRFTQLLVSEMTAWHSAVNTQERTKFKAAALIEEWLEEGNARLYDSREALNHKVELVKVLAKIAGMDRSDLPGGSTADRFSVTINLGADAKLHFEKERSPQQVIDITPEDNNA
jgi:hypothetical protein